MPNLSDDAVLICGADLAEDKNNFSEEGEEVKHAVIITRDGKHKTIPEVVRENYTRMIVNNLSTTNHYFSSLIQNGAYELLPKTIRDEFKQMHQAAQPKNSPPTNTS